MTALEVAEGTPPEAGVRLVAVDEAAMGILGLVVLGAGWGVLTRPEHVVETALVLPSSLLGPFLLTGPTVLIVQAFLNLPLSAREVTHALVDGVAAGGRFAMGMTPFVAFFALTGAHSGFVFWPVVLATIVFAGHTTLRALDGVFEQLDIVDRAGLATLRIGWFALVAVLGLQSILDTIILLHLEWR
jgi:hypothetical protein